jgi:anthrone oxygenase-like protein
MTDRGLLSPAPGRRHGDEPGPGWLAAVKWGGTAGDAAVAAAALLVVSVVMSVTVLVPINNRITTWTADDHPADWREQAQRWDRWHYARVAIIVAAFVLTLVAGTVA